MNESTLRAKVIAMITAADGHASPIESHDVSAGIPDINYCIKGHEGHIELKVGKDSRPPALRPTQHRWAVLRNRAEGTFFYLFLNNSDGNVYLIDGCDVQGLVQARTKAWANLASASWHSVNEMKRDAGGLVHCLLHK